MNRSLRALAILFAIVTVFRPGSLPAAPEWGRASRALAFYLDCSDAGCDADFLRREMPFVTWVRDRRDADLEALLQAQTTAQGGIEYTVCFLRNPASSVANDTLSFTLPPNASIDAHRRALLTVLKAGIAPDLIGTAAERDLRITVSPPESGSATGASAQGPAGDPWHAWVLGADANAYLMGDRTYRTVSFGDAVWARQVTADRKYGFKLSHYYSEQRYRLETGDLLVPNRSYSGSVRSVWSVAPHLSAGASATAYSSTFENYRFYGRAGPTIEYDLYPYDDSAGRLLTVAYGVQAGLNRYDQVTLYGKTREVLVKHTATLAVSFRQPYGTASVTADVSQYLSKPGMWRATVSGSLALNLVRGFSLTVTGYWSRVHDQIFLPAGGITDEQIIARLRQLATTYQYSVNIGLNYAFGSKVNNIVNPRLTQVYGDL